jgi:hypothetical protein
MKKKMALSLVFGVLIFASLLVSPSAAEANSTASEHIPTLVIISLSPNQTWGPVNYTAEKLGVDVLLIIIANGTGTLRITAEDLRPYNDTVFVDAVKIGIPPATGSTNATSPSKAVLDFRVLLFAVTMAKTGYLACPNGFPAQYNVTVAFTK